MIITFIITIVIKLATMITQLIEFEDTTEVIENLTQRNKLFTKHNRGGNKFHKIYNRR